MANTLTEVIPQLLAQGLMALRENAITVQLVNRAYEAMAGMKGSTIDVPIPSAITVQDVTPAATPATNTHITPTSVSLVMDQWKEAPFHLTDKEVLEAMDGTIPMQASEAIKALGNTVDSAVLALYKDIYGFAGTAGTTPFASSTGSATAIRKVLNNQLAPLGDRRIIFDADAEANALNLRAFQDVNFGVTSSDIHEGKVPKRLGFNFFMNQNTPDHTVGNLGGCAGDLTKVKQEELAGSTSILMDVGAVTNMALLKGDILVFGGHSQTYVVTANAAGEATKATAAEVAINPALTATVAASATVTLKGTAASAYAQNLAFHRDAFAFASRPLADGMVVNGGSVIASAIDPISGLTLRLELTREHKRTRFSYDILYGCKTIRQQLAGRLWG